MNGLTMQETQSLIDLIYDNNLTEKGNFNVDYWELILVKLRNIYHLQQQIKWHHLLFWFVQLFSFIYFLKILKLTNLIQI